MTRLQQQIFRSRSTRLTNWVLLAVFFATWSISSFMLISISPKANAITYDCTDVFTPLSSFVTDGVATNKSFYVQAMNETGVPWEMLAAIHYRETNFSHTNPANGQGIFQFVNGNGGPYPPGVVNDTEFYRQLKYMATHIQNDYVYRNSPNPALYVTPRQLTANEQDINLIKNTLYSYNGRSTQYANQAAAYGFSPSSQPYEGSPYVMNRFDCPRARMGIITQDYGSIDGIDTRYGAFTIFARLRGDSYWLAMTMPYSWVLYSQELYADPARLHAADSGLLAANTTYYTRVRARNIGSSTWTNTGSNPVNLATSSPGDRTSQFCDSSWLTCNRPAALKESSVAPGEVGTFEFSIKTPATYGTYKEYFNLVAENKSWMPDFGMHWAFTVAPPTYRWRLQNQAMYGDSNRTRPINVDATTPNTTYYMQVVALNTGNTTWTNTGSNPVNLATSSPGDRTSQFCDSSWLTCNRPAALKESSVAPGEVGTFEFSIKTPATYGTYKEYFNLVAENKSWMPDFGMHFPVNVRPPVALWQYTGQAAYTNNTKTLTANLAKVVNNSRLYIVVRALNTGNTTWTNTGSNPVNLATSSPGDRTSQFCDSSWLTCNRPAALKESSVAPGEVGTFEFWILAPYAVNGTSLKEYFTPVVEGKMWMNDIGLYIPFMFQTPLTSWQYQGQAAYKDALRSIPADLTNASLNTTYYLRLRLKNTGGVVWHNNGTNTLNLGTSNPRDRNSVFYDSSWITPNRTASLEESSIAPGEVGTFDFAIHSPVGATSSNEYFQPVLEGQAWLDDIGLYWSITTR